MSTEGGAKAVIAALLANLGIATAKFVAFAFTQSASMLSEAVHSLADSGNQLLLLLGGRRSRRQSTATHQFGFGRVRYVYGFIVAIVLFVVGGMYSMYEGFHKITHPEVMGWAEARVALGVLLVSIILESLSLRTALREVRAVRGDKSLWRFIRVARQPELPVIVLEDIGALTGLVFAFVGIVTAWLSGDGRWDGLGAVAIGSLLVAIAIVLTIEMSSMLVGESALEEDQAKIEAALAAPSEVERLIHLRTVYVGPDELLVAAKIAVAPDLPGREVANVIDAVEREIRVVVPAAKFIFIEPDVDRG